MNAEFRQIIHKLLPDLLQERLKLIEKINSDDYPDKDTDKKCVEELDKVIQTILDYLKHF